MGRESQIPDLLCSNPFCNVFATSESQAHLQEGDVDITCSDLAMTQFHSSYVAWSVCRVVLIPSAPIQNILALKITVFL